MNAKYVKKSDVQNIIDFHFRFGMREEDSSAVSISSFRTLWMLGLIEESELNELIEKFMEVK